RLGCREHTHGISLGQAAGEGARLSVDRLPQPPRRGGVGELGWIGTRALRHVRRQRAIPPRQPAPVGALHVQQRLAHGAPPAALSCSSVSCVAAASTRSFAQALYPESVRSTSASMVPPRLWVAVYRIGRASHGAQRREHPARARSVFSDTGPAGPL